MLNISYKIILCLFHDCLFSPTDGYIVQITHNYNYKPLVVYRTIHCSVEQDMWLLMIGGNGSLSQVIRRCRLALQRHRWPLLRSLIALHKKYHTVWDTVRRLRSSPCYFNITSWTDMSSYCFHLISLINNI